MDSLIIRQARLALPDGTLREGDVACRAGRIRAVGGEIGDRAREEIDAGGRLLLPGAIDPQVHFREPGAPHKEDLGSGSRAAVKGGVTTFLEMPNTSPPVIDQAGLDDKLARARRKCVANYGFFIGATPDNLSEINTASPVCGIKVFMGSSTGSLLVDKRPDLERIFAGGDRLIAVHAEDEARINERTARILGPLESPAVSLHSQVRDRECARLATELALELANRYERRLHVLHLSTADEVDMLRAGKPAWVTAEAVPNHLFMSEQDYERLGTLAQMNPPVRTSDDNAALWQGLHDGVLDFIATDHAPHTLAEKAQPYPRSPSGMPGVETSLPLLLTEMSAGRVTLAEVLRWMCTAAMDAYRIPDKGAIVEGYDADLVLVDMDEERPVRNEELLGRAGWSPYHGRPLVGWPVTTVVGGQVAYADGAIRPGVFGRPVRFLPGPG